MDSWLAVTSGAQDMDLSDSQSMASHDAPRDVSPPSLSSPKPGLWVDAEAAQQAHTSRMSPISSAVDAPFDSSSAPTMVHSASSSCTDTWSIGFADRDEAENEVNWEQGSDDILTIPKLEPGEDDLSMENIKPAPVSAASQSDSTEVTPVKPKRPRGRPRKHPLTPVIPLSKITKGRSKTGCITCRYVILHQSSTYNSPLCRKRKKKCDEAKPRCMSPLPCE